MCARKPCQRIVTYCVFGLFVPFRSVSLFFVERDDTCVFYINISLTEVEIRQKRKRSFYIKKNEKKSLCHRTTTSFMYKKTKRHDFNFF